MGALAARITRKIYILSGGPQVNQVVGGLTRTKPTTYSWFERTHSHNGNNKSPSSRGMLQWGILDNVRKGDPVMLLTRGRHRRKVNFKLKIV